MYIEKTTTSRQKQQIEASSEKNALSRLRSRLRLVDYATCLYIGVVGVLLIFFHRGIEGWPYRILVHAAILGLLPFYIDFAESRASKILRFLRDAYPFFLYTFMFVEVSHIINILFPFWLEPYLIKFDLFLFGNHPTVWLQRLYQPWLTELMAFSYWSYYIMLPLAGVILYLKKDKSLFFSFVFNLSLTLYICYFSYLFLTARGPHETLTSLYVDREIAGLFDRLVQMIQGSASISGAAFPSSHVAAVWVVLIYMFKFRKWLGWILLPLILSLSFSVVYMGYHYAVDSMAGILIVGLAYPLGTFLEKKFQRPLMRAGLRL